MWPAALDRQTWDQLRAVLLNPERNTNVRKATRYLLTGLIHCGGCGATLFSRPRKNARRYLCARRRPGHQLGIIADPVDELVRGAPVAHDAACARGAAGTGPRRRRRDDGSHALRPRRGGETQTLHVAVGLTAPEARRTPTDVVAEIDRLLDNHTEGGVATELTRAGIRSGTGQQFHTGIVHHIRIAHGIAGRDQRVAARGLVPKEEAAARMGICTTAVKAWHHEGRIEGERVNDKGEHYYRVPAVVPRKKIGRPSKARADDETGSATNPGGAV